MSDLTEVEQEQLRGLIQTGQELLDLDEEQANWVLRWNKGVLYAKYEKTLGKVTKELKEEKARLVAREERLRKRKLKLDEREEKIKAREFKQK